MSEPEGGAPKPPGEPPVRSLGPGDVTPLEEPKPAGPGAPRLPAAGAPRPETLLPAPAVVPLPAPAAAAPRAHIRPLRCDVPAQQLQRAHPGPRIPRDLEARALRPRIGEDREPLDRGPAPAFRAARAGHAAGVRRGVERGRVVERHPLRRL